MPLWRCVLLHDDFKPGTYILVQKRPRPGEVWRLHLPKPKATTQIGYYRVTSIVFTYIMHKETYRESYTIFRQMSHELHVGLLDMRKTCQVPEEDKWVLQ